MKGIEEIRPSEIVEIKTWLYKVRSNNLRKYYEVVERRDGTFSCSCPSFRYGNNQCKHIDMIKAFEE